MDYLLNHAPLNSRKDLTEKRPLVSVIVPVYKVESYLERCVESILEQTYDHLEIILVDDGSPDRCGEICDEYAKRDSRIKVIHQKNGGLSVARNAGLDVAQGEYIGFVDSDDYIHREMYECLVNTIIGQDADIVVCNYYLVKKGVKTPVVNYDSSLTSDSLKLDIRMNSYNAAVWIRLYKAYLFDDLRFPANRKFEDLLIMPLLYEKAKKIAGIANCFYYYNQDNEDSITNLSHTTINRKFELVWAYMERANGDELFRNKYLADIKAWAFDLLRKNADSPELIERNVKIISDFIERHHLQDDRKVLWFCFRYCRPLFNFYSRYRLKSKKQNF